MVMVSKALHIGPKIEILKFQVGKSQVTIQGQNFTTNRMVMVLKTKNDVYCLGPEMDH